MAAPARLRRARQRRGPCHGGRALAAVEIAVDPAAALPIEAKVPAAPAADVAKNPEKTADRLAEKTAEKDTAATGRVTPMSPSLGVSRIPSRQCRRR